MGFKNPWVLLWVSLGYGYGLKNLYPGKTHTHTMGWWVLIGLETQLYLMINPTNFHEF